MNNRRGVGKKYEDAASDLLTDEGYIILAKNYSCKFGEIDIIAQDREALVFIEVKYRKNIGSGFPEEAVTQSKMRKISKTADYYLTMNNYGDNINVRFDVIAIDTDETRHYKNAFTYRGSNY